MLCLFPIFFDYFKYFLSFSNILGLFQIFCVYFINLVSFSNILPLEKTYIFLGFFTYFVSLTTYFSKFSGYINITYFLLKNHIKREALVIIVPKNLSSFFPHFSALNRIKALLLFGLLLFYIVNFLLHVKKVALAFFCIFST